MQRGRKKKIGGNYDDDSTRTCGFDDRGEAPVVAAGGVACAEGFEDEATETGDFEDAVNHFGLDAGEDAQARYLLYIFSTSRILAFGKF